MRFSIFIASAANFVDADFWPYLPFPKGQNGIAMKKSRFFKVGDTLTMM